MSDAEHAHDIVKALHLLKSTLESQAGTIIFSIDRDYRYLFFNQAHADAMRRAYDRDVELGGSILDCITSDEDRAAAKDNYDRALAGESHTNIRVFGDVDRCCYESFFNPIVAPDGSIIGATGLARDISDRLRRDEERRQSEERFAALFERAPLGYQSLDEDGRFIEVNPAWLETLGYEREEVIGAWFGDFLAPEYTPAFRERFPMFKERGTVHSEFLMRHKDGSHRYVAFDGRVGHNPDGSFRQTHCILTDVTERRATEEALRASEGLHRAILQTSVDGYWLVDLQGHLLDVNDAYCRMSGYSSQELLRMSVDDLNALESPADVADRTERVRSQGHDRFQSQHRRKDGTVFDVEVSAQYFPADGGRIVAFTRDITERVRAESALQASHDMLKNLTAQVPGVVYQYRLYPDGRSAFPFSSPGMNDIYEYSPEEVRDDATPVFGRLHPDDLDRVAADIDESARTLGQFHSEFRVVLPRQGLRWRLSDATPRRMDDGSTLWYGIISDITERKEAEAALARLNAELEERVRGRTEELTAKNEELVEANTRLDEATRAKSAFLANMSHELRTPLNSIIGFSGLLAQGLAGPLNEEQSTQIGMVNRSGRHLLALIDEILDLSKIESGMTTIQLEELDPAQLLVEVADTLRPLSEAKGVDLRLALPDAGHTIVSDRGKLLQVLLNLAGNAVKFTDSGYVLLAYGPRDENSIELSVTDTGPGIPTDRLEYIFAPFSQVDDVKSAKPPGTGLGLTISREYASLLGGEVAVTSELGEGSQFLLTLPVKHPGSRKDRGRRGRR